MFTYVSLINSVLPTWLEPDELLSLSNSHMMVVQIPTHGQYPNNWLIVGVWEMLKVWYTLTSVKCSLKQFGIVLMWSYNE